MIRGGRLVAAALVAVATSAPAATAADAVCTGVLVVVAPGDADDTSIGCATGTPSSGLAALTDVGHRYTFVPGVPGMVCTIDGHPDPCNGAPAGAYWSYWHADPGGEWAYSTLGAADRQPPPGTVDGWVFGAGHPPPSPAPSGDEIVTATGPTEQSTTVPPVVAVTAGLLIVGLGGAAVRRARARPGDGSTTRSPP